VLQRVSLLQVINTHNYICIYAHTFTNSHCWLLSNDFLHHFYA
jgi:hypothetical protein